MKRIVTLLLAAVMVFGAVPTAVFAADSDFVIEDGVLTSYLGDGGDVVIPDGVTSIGNEAFFACYGLTNVTIPDSVTSIGEAAFANCSSLVAINVSDRNGSYKSEDGVLFSKDGTELLGYPGGKSGKYVIPGSVTSIGEAAFRYCSSLTSVTIPDSVTSIGDWAFEDCSSLTSITIPDSVTSIGYGAFTISFSKLTAINVSDRNGSYKSVDGVLFSKDGTFLLKYPDGKSGEYVIPNSVTSIGDLAFGGCSSLTNITIPDSVTSIGDWAFEVCSSLTSITIPASVTEIGWSAFDCCSSLTDVYYGGSDEEWNSITIDKYNEPLLNATIHYNSTIPDGEDIPSKPDYEINQYISNYIANHNTEYYTPAGEKTSQSNLLEFYTDPTNESPARILLDTLEGDAGFMNTFHAWEIATFDPSAVTDGMLDQIGYYEAILFNILDCQFNSAEFISENAAETAKLSLGISGAVTKLIKTTHNIDYEAICDLPWGEIDVDLQHQLIEEAGKELNKWDSRNAGIEDLSEIVDTSLTVKQYIDSVATLGQLSKCQEDVKAVLYDLYANCPSSNTAMKTALYEVYTVCSDSFNAFQASIINGAVTVGNKVLGDVLKASWEKCITSLDTSGIAAGILIGQAIGKGLSNILCSMDKVSEQFYIIKSIYEFEDLMCATVKRLETSYKNDDSIENAKVYLKSIDMLFSTRELSCDYATECMNAFFNEGIINKINRLFGESQTYTGFVKSVESIKKYVKDARSTLLDIDSYKEYLAVDYPEVYKEYYGEYPYWVELPTDNIYLSKTSANDQYYFSYRIEDGVAVITGYQGIYGGDIAIPSTIDGYSVAKIDDEAFYGCDNLMSIVVPDEVTNIGDQAFIGCDNVTLRLSSGSYAETYAIENAIPYTVATPGDANGDDSIDLKDVYVMIRHAAGWTTTGFVFAAADINADGEVTLKDVAYLIHHLAGWEDYPL